MFEISYHSIVLLLGIAVAGLSLVGAIGVGPYGRRGVRLMLVAMSFAAFLGSAVWFTIYLGFIEQRRSIETRLSELRGQALGPGSPLACLERAGGAVEAACAQTIFAAPETLAAAHLYTATRLDLFAAATRYTGPRTPQFDETIDALETSLQQDPFGLTANVLMLRKGCTAERCDEIASFQDPARLWSNIKEKSFEANVAHHSANWRTPATTLSPTAAAPLTPGIAPTGETRAPIPDKYTLPSAASIPPVSIMNDEPARGAEPTPPPAKEQRPPRPPANAAARDEQAPPAPPAATSSAPEKPAASERPAPARRERPRPNAPLAITPQQ